MQHNLDTYPVWECISYAWSEIGIEDEECRALAHKAGLTVADLPAIDRLFFRDICASFAVESIVLFIPIVGWACMTDWGYAESYLRRRINNWYAKPYWLHFLNPLRIVGYPFALLCALDYRTKLHQAIRENADTNI